MEVAELHSAMLQGFAEMRTEIRDRSEVLREELTGKIDSLRGQLTAGIESVDGKIENLRESFTERFESVDGKIENLREDFTERFEQTDRRMVSLDKFVSGLGPLMERILERIEVINEVCDHNEDMLAAQRGVWDPLDTRVLRLEVRVNRLETRKK